MGTDDAQGDGHRRRDHRAGARPADARQELFGLLADLLESVAAQAKEAAKEGLSLEDARKKLDVHRFREQFAHGDEQTGRAFDGFFLGPGFPRAYREAKEGPLHDET